MGIVSAAALGLWEEEAGVGLRSGEGLRFACGLNAILFNEGRLGGLLPFDMHNHPSRLDRGSHPPRGRQKPPIPGVGFNAWRYSRVQRRTVRAQGASSGSTTLVFVVQLTRGGASGTLARSAAALPRAICYQAYSLKRWVTMDRGIK